MKIAAIIAEYNPFHNGHFYQLKETRRTLDADYVVILLSGDFVQRGAPALCNKYLRTKMALSCGADAVFELPVRYALSSADGFAGGAVRLLDQLGAVDFLSFGSECGEVRPLMDYAQLLCRSEQEPGFQKLLLDRQKQGMSFPFAREQAIAEFFSTKSNLLRSPNNILGIEYCKAILTQNSSIKPFTIRRSGEDHHSTSLPDVDGAHVSATAIRQELRLNGKLQKEYVPASVSHILQEQRISHDLLSENDFSLLLYYKLLCEQSLGFSSYLDCSKELSDKMIHYLNSYVNFEQFCSRLKSKELTYTRISRVLMHILLNIRTDLDVEDEVHRPYVPYARLLGFRNSSSPLLNRLKKCSTIPIISKPADAGKLLTSSGIRLFKEDISSAHVYEAVYAAKAKETIRNEYRQSPIIL